MSSLLSFNEQPRQKLQRQYGLKALSLTDEEVSNVYKYIREVTRHIRGFDKHTVYTDILHKAIISGEADVMSVMLSTDTYRTRAMDWLKIAIYHKKMRIVVLILTDDKGSAIDYNELAHFAVMHRCYEFLPMLVCYVSLPEHNFQEALWLAVDTQIITAVYALLTNKHCTTREALPRAAELGATSIVRALLEHPTCDVSYANYAAVDKSITLYPILVCEIARHTTYRPQERHAYAAINEGNHELLQIVMSGMPWVSAIVERVIATFNNECIEAVMDEYSTSHLTELVEVLCKLDSFPYLDRLINKSSLPLESILLAATSAGAIQCLDIVLQYDGIEADKCCEVVRDQCRRLDERVIMLLAQDGRVDLTSDDNTLFVTACRKGRCSIVTLLLDYPGVDVNCRRSLPLRLAIEENDWDLLEVLAADRRLVVSSDYHRHLLNTKCITGLEILRKYGRITTQVKLGE